MKKKALFLCAAMAILLCAAAITAHASGFFDFSSRQRETVTITREEYNRLQRFSKLDTILEYVEDWYWQEPDVDEMLEYAIHGMLSALDDPYTFYYNEEEWAEMWEDDEGEYVGVGMELLGNAETNIVTVTRVFSGTPSEKGGVRKGDLLVRVEDIEVNAYTLNDAVSVMRGKKGEEVEIEVKRGNEYITLKLIKDVIVINRVEYKMLEDGVGYIMLYKFAGESQKEFADALKALRDQGAKALVVDLRDNGGGWVQFAVDIADLFLDEELLVYSEDRYGGKEEMKTAAGKDDIPLVILVNGNTASSSEILSGGLQDLGRATIVGTQSFGKGIIQAVLPLEGDKDGFQMTYAQYFLPSGTAVHKVGVTPDILSEMPEEMQNQLFSLGDMSDPQLYDAWQAAREMIPR